MAIFNFGRKPAEPAPAAAVQKQPTNRAKLARMVARMFDAGKSDRLTESWTTTPLTADDIIKRNQRILVARSRQQAANNDYARKFVKMAKVNIVGSKGIQLNAETRDNNGALDSQANEALESFFNDWSQRHNCDITGRHSFRDLCNLAVASAAVDGEFFFKKIRGRDAGKWRFALQALDAQRCPPDLDVDRLQSGNHIRQGIEFNSYGRPVAYYFTTTKDSAADYSHNGRSFTRIPADEVIHGFVSDMVGQRRGLPWMATALWRLGMLNGFENAALVNARLGASKGGFFEWREGYGPEADEDQEIYMEAEPGSFQELPAGVQFKAWDPQYPNGEFQPFHKSILRGISSGLGVAYNNLASDLEGVNFSSIRQGTLDEREHWKELQEWLIEQLIMPLWGDLLPIALLVGIKTPTGGTLRPEQLTKYQSVSWQPRRWQWIDPRADVDAAIKSKNSLLTSPGQIMREQGRDPDRTWRELAADIAAMKAAGIPDRFIEIAMGININAQQQAPAQGGEDADQPGAE